MQGGFAAQLAEQEGVERTTSGAGIRQTSYNGIISQCSQMRRVFGMIEKVARSSSTVLILGESGTGKELVARALHKQSARKGRLVPVNCGAIPEEILESELFGHEKGAFTGAVGTRVGRFQLADGGTIFLDEIGEMSPKLQVKLLRVLQEKCIEPVGSTKSIPVDVRIVAATNKDLWNEVQAGNFREDLFFRLQVVPIELPALREREGDIELLAKFFLERSASKEGRASMSLSPEAVNCLKRHEWTGNVRELENLIDRMVLLSDGDELGVSDVPSYIRESSRSGGAGCTLIEIDEAFPEDGISFNELVNNFETRLISKALEKTGWNKKAAAKLLNLNRTTLVEKIKKKGIEPELSTTQAEPVRPNFA